MKIRALIDAYSIAPPFKLTTNQYIITFSEIGPTVKISQKSGGEGTHQNTWLQVKHLVETCKLINIGKLTDQNDKAGIEAISDNLSDVISKAGSSGKSLSEVRNDVQYRQLYGVWPPYGSSLRGDYCLRKVEEIKSRKTEFDSFDVKNSDAAVSFINNCFLFCWVIEKFVECISEASSRSFLKNKTLKW
ncbi:hypothetical protein HFN60_24340 [Rhizobium leguminosarum]|uniref:hypothetical protein n=1 Tax=Rhizobium leguminosarum TaxID=384 RepID=UPI001C968DB9|nr:hypothetical protein [Rhizobium leguminosarum]MBY5818736.1 hypothetical protein [Rhizobium leguminosarum]